MVRSRPSRSSIVGSQPSTSRARGDVGLAQRRIVVRQRHVDDLGRRAGELEHQLGQLADRELVRVADVDRRRDVGVEQGEEPADLVVDVA